MTNFVEFKLLGGYIPRNRHPRWWVWFIRYRRAPLLIKTVTMKHKVLNGSRF